jgi:hypothetical protein
MYDSHTGNAGPENVINLATFQALIGPAFDADAGGVVDAEAARGSRDDQDIIANFGVRKAKSVTFTDTTGNLSWGDGGSSGGRLPTSGDGRFVKQASPPDWVFDISPVTGGVPGEAVTYVAGTVLYRDNRELNPQVTATFSGGGTVTAIADMPEGAPANSLDAFFGFVAPPGESIVNVNFDLAQWTNLDDLAFITSAFAVALGEASDPSPENEQTDVPRDVVLNWTPGEFVPPVNGHKVYLSENFADVNDGIGGIVQSAGSYAPPQRLDFDKTYYWRVDEVNAPPDSTVFRGNIWSFTTEPAGYPIANVTATASSSAANQGPANATVDGSGLTDDLHSMATADMWLSGFSAAQPSWIQFELDKVYPLHEMWVWNSNTELEGSVGFGFKDVTIEYSLDGTDYAALGTTHEFAQAPAADGYAHNTTVDFGGLQAQYVRLTANSNWGGFLPQSGLSEVRFFHVPVRARKPHPDSGAIGVSVDVTLDWRAGREAAEHNLYLSADEQAVIDGTSPVTVASDTSHSPLSLDLDSTYYWRVDEVNDAEIPTTWQGDVWNLSTQEFLVVDDFESYNDIPAGEEGSNLVYETWKDGLDDPTTNGSTMGYFVPFEPTMETGTVHGGGKSAPMIYNNTTAAFSEVTRTLAPQNWTDHGIQTLSLWFYGDPANTPGQLYVKINGVRVNYAGDSANLGRLLWKRWNIELAAVGTNLQGVTSLAVGVEGFGATGTLLLDSIALYKSVSEPPVEVYLEAEAATPLGASWRTYIDPASIGGQHIGSEDGDGTDGDAAPGPEWTAVYSFDVPVEGVYKVVLRAQETGSDSFWVRIVGATSQTHEDPAQPGTGWVKFNGIDAPDGWAWDEVHSNDHDNTVVNWTLAAGEHTLEIAKREDGVLLDAILITDDIAPDQTALP